MKETMLELSENGWEYIGTATIKSKNTPKKVSDTTIEVDGVTFEFDDEINIVCTNDIR